MTLTRSLDQASSTIHDAGLRIQSLQSTLDGTKRDLAQTQEELARLALVLDTYAAATEAGQPTEGNQLRLISGALAAAAQSLTKSSDALRDDVIAGI
ncbi:hypothetical protein CH275_10350 [Rhodococcus sp. 06-235-1A]|uniref:hypothetical protein n=1 Tax=Rhodococcus sp. 06-235-1A TaxID=2022508 RepID=UPI000B9ADE25|nr:hypothetical protein [Rhodococcus sp. 06-235-1A]OZD06601.1 hypothetical protein CH275_10350 [Rhodococcus sp. 06-235-1A]